MRLCYTIYVCPDCDESYQYAGFCDTCSKRLLQTPAFPAMKVYELAATMPDAPVKEFIKRLSS